MSDLDCLAPGLTRAGMIGLGFHLKVITLHCRNDNSAQSETICGAAAAAAQPGM